MIQCHLKQILPRKPIKTSKSYHISRYTNENIAVYDRNVGYPRQKTQDKNGTEHIILIKNDGMC